jgi:hypothetical protein
LLLFSVWEYRTPLLVPEAWKWWFRRIIHKKSNILAQIVAPGNVKLHRWVRLTAGTQEAKRKRVTEYRTERERVGFRRASYLYEKDPQFEQLLHFPKARRPGRCAGRARRREQYEILLPSVLGSGSPRRGQKGANIAKLGGKY